MDLKEVEVGGRFLYNARSWRDSIIEVTLIEISPNKKMIKVRYANGNDHWEDKDEWSEWEILDKLPPKVNTKIINLPPVRIRIPRRVIDSNLPMRAK